MAVYSTVLPDERIISEVTIAQATNISLVVCGGCTNESLAFLHKLPIFTSAEGDMLGESMANNRAIPYSAYITAERIAEMLRNEGYSVNISMIPLAEELLCIQKGDHSTILNCLEETELILALCCPAGAAGIRRQIKNIPIVTLMKPQGQLFYVYKDDLFTRQIVYDESAVIN